MRLRLPPFNKFEPEAIAELFPGTGPILVILEAADFYRSTKLYRSRFLQNSYFYTFLSDDSVYKVLRERLRVRINQERAKIAAKLPKITKSQFPGCCGMYVYHISNVTDKTDLTTTLTEVNRASIPNGRMIILDEKGTEFLLNGLLKSGWTYVTESSSEMFLCKNVRTEEMAEAFSWFKYDAEPYKPGRTHANPNYTPEAPIVGYITGSKESVVHKGFSYQDQMNRLPKSFKEIELILLRDMKGPGYCANEHQIRLNYMSAIEAGFVPMFEENNGVILNHKYNTDGSTKTQTLHCMMPMWRRNPRWEEDL